MGRAGGYSITVHDTMFSFTNAVWNVLVWNTHILSNHTVPDKAVWKIMSEFSLLLVLHLS